MHDVVPDMVTIGKPIANGYPLSALVTTHKIASAFCKGHRTYFNTYGGAPVSMAAGLATLEVIEDEGLQQNAKETGEYLKEKLLQLKSKHWMMADVRGIGLFVGFELSKLKRITTTTTISYLSLLTLQRGSVACLLSTPKKIRVVSVFHLPPPLSFLGNLVKIL